MQRGGVTWNHVPEHGKEEIIMILTMGLITLSAQICNRLIIHFAMRNILLLVHFQFTQTQSLQTFFYHLTNKCSCQ